MGIFHSKVIFGIILGETCQINLALLLIVMLMPAQTYGDQEISYGEGEIMIGRFVCMMVILRFLLLAEERVAS